MRDGYTILFRRSILNGLAHGLSFYVCSMAPFVRNMIYCFLCSVQEAAGIIIFNFDLVQTTLSSLCTTKCLIVTADTVQNLMDTKN